MKILYVATIGGFMPFFKSLIRELIDGGNEVDIAANMSCYPLPEYYREWGCGIYQLSCSRSPLSKGNWRCVKELKKIVSEKRYNIVHCHTPVAAVCTRIACREVRKTGTKVIYTAHGFHFYSGAPLKNWILFYPVEKLCSRWTDVLITINEEDYKRAKNHFHIRRIEYVPGVGIDVHKFANAKIDRDLKRKELEIPENAFVLFSVGELNQNKNHQVVLRAMSILNDANIHYVIAGKGDQKKILVNLADELGISSQLHLIGYRKDVPELYKMSDVYLLPSIREGLNVSVMEAMASGLPCIVSDIRGNRDMIDNGKGGFLFKTMDYINLNNRIKEVKGKIFWGLYNKEKVQKYDRKKINKNIKKIYRNAYIEGI